MSLQKWLIPLGLALALAACGKPETDKTSRLDAWQKQAMDFVNTVSAGQDAIEMQLIVKSVNASLKPPVKLNDEVQLDGVSSSDNKTLEYNYRLLNSSVSEFSPEELETLKKASAEDMCSGLREGNATALEDIDIRVNYTDSSGAPMSSVVVKTKECLKA